MNFWAFGLLFSVFIWSIFYERSLLLIYGLTIGFYAIMNFWNQKKALNSFRRKIQIATWNDSGDPSVFGRLEVDMTKIDEFLDKYNKENPDNKLSYTIIFAKAIGAGMSSSNKLNGKICFGQFIPCPSVDISVLVDIDGKNLANTLLKGCNLYNLRELNENLKNEVKKLKTGKNNDFNEQVNTMKYIPSFVIQAILRIASWISYDLGMSFPLLKVKPDNFGYAVLTNISGFGVTDCTAPLVPFCKTIIVAVMNTPQLKPMVVDNEIKIRKVMNFNITYDHRFGDGSDAVKMLKAVTEVFENPSKYL
jgi:pyruvate/2-oxoglutarate dehydrogenase complex dihydrolipoamide acyltransferase (E2) component